MVTTVEPVSSLLKKYIETFYLFNTWNADNIRYLAFPHTNTGLSFFKRATVTRQHFEVTITGEDDGAPDYCIELLGKYTQPVLVSYHGRIEEIAIVFKPLGMNRFIDTDFIKIAPQYSQPFTSGRWLEVSPILFASSHPIQDLEAFLLSIISEKQDLEQMEAALVLLEDNLSDYSITDIAQKTGLSFKMFQRYFTRALGCSPSDYRRIAKFRNALRSRLHAKELKSLTSISYESNYSDQSYFIREFRKLTNHNPKLFFKEVSLIDGDKIVWEIL